MNRAIPLLLAALAGAGARQEGPNLRGLAEHIVHALEPVAGERIILRVDPGTFPSLTPVVVAALEGAGTKVDLWSGAGIQDFERRLESATVYVWMPGASRITSPDQSAALRRWVDQGGARRELHFHWSEGTLRDDGGPAGHSPAFDRMYADALDIDYAALRTRQDAAIALLRSGEVRVRTAAGTDLRFHTGTRPFNRQDGDGSRRRVARGLMRIDRHIELPAGIVRVAPVEDSVQGVIVVPAMNIGGRRLEQVRLEFAKGRIQSATVAEGQSVLDDRLKAAPALTHFREFALGFNRALVSPPQSRVVPYYGYGDGVVRLSLGDNEELGGQVRGGAVMWNFFTDATVSVGDRLLVTAGRPDR